MPDFDGCQVLLCKCVLGYWTPWQIILPEQKKFLKGFKLASGAIRHFCLQWGNAVMHKMPKMPPSMWIRRPRLYRWPPPFSTKVKWRSSRAQQWKRRTQKSVVEVAVQLFFELLEGKTKLCARFFFLAKTLWDIFPKMSHNFLLAFSCLNFDAKSCRCMLILGVKI